jgi:phospholipid/cholesterol/gamma-HCH transport system permease protein
VTAPRNLDDEPTEIQDRPGVRGPDAGGVLPGPVIAGPGEPGRPTVHSASAPPGQAHDADGTPQGSNGQAGSEGAASAERSPSRDDRGAADAGGDGDARPVTVVSGAVVAGVKDAAAPVLGFLEAVGDHLILVARALAWLPRRPFRLANYLDAAEYIGFGSLPIVLLVGAFTGAVTSLQSVYAFSQFGLESFSGGATGKALAVDLGPVLTSLMLAGRASSGIATELGTMRITEQIDALESMAVSPVQYLVLPRLLASMVVMPILALTFFVVGMGGAWLVAVVVMHVDQGQWIANLRDLVDPIDVVQGLIKSVFFGFLVALVGCYQGYNASGGGRGVAMGTTRAVVIASVSTLVVDFFLTDILHGLLSSGPG